MKKILVAIALLLSLATFAQNGGQVNATLPVRFEFLKVEPITNKTFKISFRVNEAETVDRFIISFSEDGRTYKSIMLVYPNKLEPNKTYTEIITLK